MKLISLILISMFSMNTFSIESLKYDVLEKDDNIEIRKYQKHITASVTFTDKEEFDRSAFRTLADYIFGNNISMTSPVLTEGEKIAMTAPVLSDNGQTSWTMSFSMPSEYTLETLPTPKNSRVKIQEIEEKTMAAIRFSGFMSDYNFNRYENTLRNYLDENNHEVIVNFLRAGYNPPWTLPFLRRNEVIVEIK